MKTYFAIPFLALSITLMDPCSQKAKMPIKTAPVGANIFDVEVVYPEFISSPVTHDVEGKTEPSEKTDLAAPAAGDLEKVFVNVGDVVKMGDPLFSMSAEDVRREIELKKSKSKEAASRLKSTKSKMATTQKPLAAPTPEDTLFLDEENAVPQTATPSSQPSGNVETLKDLAEVLEAMVSRYDLEVAALESLLTDLEVKSPVNGIVMDRFLAEGARAKTGDKILTLATFDPLSVTFHLPEAVASFVDKQSEVFVKMGSDQNQIKTRGVVYYVDPDVDGSTKSFLVKAHIDNADGRLKGGQNLQVGVATNRTNRTLVIPQKAVVHEGSTKTIFVVSGNQARLVKIEIGQSFDSGDVEVRGMNLRVDDAVIVNRPVELKSNDFVRVKVAGDSSST